MRAKDAPGRAVGGTPRLSLQPNSLLSRPSDQERFWGRDPLFPATPLRFPAWLGVKLETHMELEGVAFEQCSGFQGRGEPFYLPY